MHDQIPVSPSELPQQKVYEVVQIPVEPKDFEASCLIYSDRNDYSWSLPEDKMPKRFPGSAKFIGQFEWAWGMYNTRIDGCYICSNTKKTHWFIWIRTPDENSYSMKFDCVLYTYCPRTDNDVNLAAIILLRYVWRFEATETTLDQPHWINNNGILSIPEIMAISREIW
jgi:hypothetical protein